MPNANQMYGTYVLVMLSLQDMPFFMMLIKSPNGKFFDVGIFDVTPIPEIDTQHAKYFVGKTLNPSFDFITSYT